MATSLTKFTDAAGREAYKDNAGMVFTEGGNRATNYSVNDWNTRQTEKYGSIPANQIKAPVSVPYSSDSQSQYLTSLTSQEDKTRKNLTDMLKQQKSDNEKRLNELKAKEQSALNNVQQLTTPFRADLEKTQRESLYVNQNFEANQQLVNELDTLLTQGNDLIKQQSEVTGLAAVRNPRIQKTMNDVAARAGVIEAVINARNGQIAQAYTMIDRSVSAITADRQDQISYYETVINLNRQDMISLDEDSKRIAGEQLNIAKSDLARAQETTDYIKQLLINPSTAGLMGEAGVKLTDSVEKINSKLKEAEYNREVRDGANEFTSAGAVAVMNPSSVPADQLVSFTDSRGQVHYYKLPKTSKSSGSNWDMNGFLKTLSAQGLDVSMPIDTSSLWDEVLTGQAKLAGPIKTTDPSAPKFSPAGGVGTIYTDSTGQKWSYTVNGWIRI